MLNRGFLPLDIVSDRDAISLLYQNKVFTVVESEKVMRSPSIVMKVPLVIASLTYSHMPIRKVHFSKLNVIYRDDQTCQYCGKQFPVNQLEIDHIIPKSRWRIIKHTSKCTWTNWLNCVCVCHWCNNAKGNKLPEEIGWKLLRKPFEPKYLPHIVISRKKAEQNGWLPFMNFNVKFVDIIP